jgi:hypothetical protein
MYRREIFISYFRILYNVKAYITYMKLIHDILCPDMHWGPTNYEIWMITIPLRLCLKINLISENINIALLFINSDTSQVVTAVLKMLEYIKQKQEWFPLELTNFR